MIPLHREGRRGGSFEPDPPLKASAFFPSQEGTFQEKFHASI
jgi:hypothetical protein